VKEAYRLLNKSIIRVEQPDIHLDEEEQLADEPMDLEGENAAAPDAQAVTTNGTCMSLSHGPGQVNVPFPSWFERTSNCTAV
jgi:hypothetical protein